MISHWPLFLIAIVLENVDSGNMNGVFFAIQPTGTTRNTLLGLNEIYGIKNPVSALTYHTTLVLSQRDCPGMQRHPVVFPLIGIGTGFDLFSDTHGKSNVLVMRVDSDHIRALHQELLQYGPDSKYPIYQPHITLAHEWEGELPVLAEPISIWYNSHLYCPREERHSHYR